MPINYDDAQYTNELGDPINATDAAESTPAIAIPKPGTPAAVVPDAETDYANEMKRIREEMKTNQSASRATVDDMVRAQAIEGVMSGIIKAFAGARGLKTGRDLSGVDVKTGIDWNAAMNGKLGTLRDEAAALRGEKSDIGQGLSARLRSKAAGESATAKKAREVDLDAQEQARMNLKITAEKHANTARLADLEIKRTAAGKKDSSDKIGGSAAASAAVAGRDVAAIEKSMEKLDTYATEMTSKDKEKASVAEGQLRQLLVSKGGMSPKDVLELKVGDLVLAKQRVAVGMEREARAARVIQNALLQANATKSKEDYDAAIAISHLGKAKIDPDAPAGTVTRAVTADTVREAAIREFFKTGKNPDGTKAMRPDKAAYPKVDKMIADLRNVSKNTFWDERYVDTLEKIRDGVNPTEDELKALPPYLFPDVSESYIISDDPAQNEAKKNELMARHGARLGVGSK